MRIHRVLRIEELEPRIAPATSQLDLVTSSGVGYDFNSDGYWDTVTYDRQNGNLFVDLMDANGNCTGGDGKLGTYFIGQQKDASLELGGAGNWVGAGRTDILWHNTTSGDVVAWQMSGLSTTGATTGLGTTSAQWRIGGVADFDNNGTTDILWQDKSSGEINVWLMNRTQVISTVNVGSGDPNLFHVVAAGDINGDGQADVLAENLVPSDGNYKQLTAWLITPGNLSSHTEQALFTIADAAHDYRVGGVTKLQADATSNILLRGQDSLANAAFVDEKMDASLAPTPRLIYERAPIRAAFMTADADASLPLTAGETSGNLIAILPDNPQLQWRTVAIGGVPTDCVLLQTWTKYAFSPSGTALGDYWCSVGSEVQNWYATHAIAPEDLYQRTTQLLGMPADTVKYYFAEIYVPVLNAPGTIGSVVFPHATVWRPTPDPNYENHSSTFPEVIPSDLPDPTYSAWYINWRDNVSYKPPGPGQWPGGYPWTRLGYTYDWADPYNHFGMSEFIVPQGTPYVLNDLVRNDVYWGRIYGTVEHATEGHAVQYTDSDGNLVTASLQGPGDIEVILPDDGVGDAIAMNATGTNETSFLFISVSQQAGHGDGETTVGSFKVGTSLDPASLGGISGAQVDLGTGGEIVGNGWIGSIRLGDMDGSDRIALGGSTASAPVTLRFNSVMDLSVAAGAPIQSITAAQWQSTDINKNKIQAPWIGTMSLNEMGAGSAITVQGPLTSFYAPKIGDSARLNVSGTFGDFLAYAVGNGAALSVGGDMTRFFVPGTIGTGGSVSVGGSLNTFNAYTVGDGLRLNVANDINTLVTVSLGAGSGITAGRNVGNIWSYGNIGNGSAFTVGGAMGNFQGATIGDDFSFGVAGTMGDFRANSLGQRADISSGGNMRVFSAAALGTDGNVSVGGSLTTFNVTSVEDGLALNVTNDLSSFNAKTVGAGAGVSVGGTLAGLSAQSLGNGVGVRAGTALTSFYAPSIGDNLNVCVTTGTLGDFMASTVGDDLAISVAGNMNKFYASGSVGTGGRLMVGGSLNQFSAPTVGDGFGLNVTNGLGNFQAGMIGSDFGLQVTGGSLGSFQTSALGAQATISVRDNATLIYAPTMGTGGSFTVGGTLGTFGTSVLSDGSRLNVTGDLNSFSAPTLGNGVSINVGGKLPGVSVNAIGNNTGITAGSGLSSFSSPSVGNNFRLQVTGTSGDFLANTVGDGLGVSVSGDMTKVFVQGRIGTGGSVSVGGSLSTFNAYTVGDGFGLNVANDLTTLVTNSLGAGSGITAGRNVGNVYSYSSIGNGSTIIIQGALGNFQGATIGNDFHLDVTGTMGAFRSNVLGARPTISVGGSASLISVSNVGTGGHIIVGGTLSKFNASIVGDALDVNVTGDLPYFNANTAGAGLKVSVGGSLTNMFIQKSSLKDATITAGQGIAGIYAYQGGIQGASTITANGTAGIGTVSASAGGFSGTLGAPNGNITQLRANGDVNATINSSGTLGALTILGGSVPSPRKLSGLIDVRVISSIYGVYTEMENLTIRATDSNAGISVQSMKDVILSAGAIGSLRASQDVTGTRPNSSLILAGYDIGPDLAFGGPDDGPFTSGAATGDITRLYIGGTVQNSTVRAGGNIQTLIMGATTHSNFIAGASVEAFRENKPCATEPSDFADPQATIAALQVVGVTTGGGGIATPAMSDSNFSAPNYGNLSLLNGPDWNAFAVIVLDNQNHIQSVTYRDTTDSQNNWYWQPGQEWKGGTPLDVITPSRWTFAFMADFRTAHTGTGVNVTAATAIAGQASGFGVDFALAAGDLVEGLTSSWPDNIGPSLDQQFKSFKAAMVAGGLYLAGDTSGSGIPYYPVRGNHELHHEIHPEENILQVWMDNFGNYVPQNGPAGEVGLTYAFTYGNGVFLMVDEYVNLMIVNQPWVDQQLAANAGQQQVFAVGHTAAFALAAAETLADNPAQRDALLTSLYNAGERVFLAGHDHLSARADVPVIDSTGTAIGTMEQIITPSGAPFMPVPWDGQYRDSRVVPREFVDATMGYQLVKVDGPNVTVEFWGTTDGCTRTWDPVTQEYNYTYSTDSTNWTWSKVDSYTFSGT